jgi:hypothetical protein
VNKDSVYDVSGNAAGENSSTGDMKLNDMSVPVIAGHNLSPDNMTLTVIFSEGVYADKGAAGALEKSDFQIKFDKNGGTAAGADIDALVHEPGTVSAEVTLAITGTPSGKEYVMVSPRKDSVFDASGNAAEESTNTGKVFLNNQVMVPEEHSQTVYTGDPVSFGAAVMEEGQPGSSLYGAEVDIVHPAVPFWKLVQKHRKWILEKMEKTEKDPLFDAAAFKPGKEIPSISGRKKEEESKPLADRIYETMMKNKKIAAELAKKNTISIKLEPEKVRIKQSPRWTGPLLTHRLRRTGSTGSVISPESLKVKKGLLSVRDIRDRITLSYTKYKTLFTGFLKRAEVPGEYVITYRIRGAGKECGTYERTLTKFYSVTVRPHPKYTKITGTYDEKNSCFIVTITPRDSQGNLFVPGSEHRLTCILDGHERLPAKNIVGDINSSFAITIPMTKKEELRKRRLLIKSEGVVLFDGFPGDIKAVLAASQKVKAAKKPTKRKS